MSATNVWAVGDYNTSKGGHRYTLAEQWNGLSWTTLTTSNPSSEVNQLLSVASAFKGDTITKTIAVGYYSASTSPYHYHALAEHWNSNQFVSDIVPEPNVATSTQLSNVYAIPNSNDFWAAGEYEDTTNFNYKALIERWSGATNSWAATTLGLSGHSQLFAVAAYDVNHAWAVGYLNDPPSRTPLVLYYNGSSWTTMTVPSPPGGEASFTGVDVFTPSDVWAVGYYIDAGHLAHNLTEHYNGTTWSIEAAPDPGDNNQISKVWVTTAGDVWAVGQFSFNQHNQQDKAKAQPLDELRLGGGKAVANVIDNYAMILHWNGSSWDNVSALDPGADNNLVGVGAALTSTWAVGYFDDTTLVERMIAPRTAPKYVNSHYESSVDTKNHYKQGCNAAHQNTEGGIAVLDYGQPRKIQRGPAQLYGTSLFQQGGLVDTNQIATAVESYTDGYDAAYNITGNCGYIGSSKEPIVVAIGTSNSNQDLSANISISHAQAWADMVSVVKAYVAAHGYSEITIAAAMDIEPNFSIPFAPTPTPINFDYDYPKVATWVSSYTGRGLSPLYNYGSTDGFPCPPSGTPVPVDYPCSVWNVNQLYNISWGIPGAKPLPEAYYAQFNRNWYVVKRYGELAYPTATPMTFVGSMTDCLPSNVCYVNPADPNRVPELWIHEGWGSLWNEINSDPFYTQSITWSTYITYTNQ